MTSPPDILAGCSHDTCFAPDTACVLGNLACEHLAAGEGSVPAAAAGGAALPWSGLPLGLADASVVAATARHRVVALVGLAEAGKTTALAAHWVAARRGGGRHGRMFAGSYTLIGWHQIARHLQWVPFGSGGFPPHTSAAGSRVPALLHAGYDLGDAPLHAFYTDVPGEWFRAWAYDETSSEGASWIATNADAFVLVADSAALAGAERGTARADYEALAERLASIAHGRNVVAMRTKADIDVSAPVLSHIEALNRRLFAVETVPVSVHERVQAPITDVIDLGLEAATRPRVLSADEAPPRRDAMLAFRSNHYAVRT